MVEEYYYGGLGFFSVLTLIFITLKLLNKIDWSWLWVLSPLWLPITIGALVSSLILVGIYLWTEFC